MKLDKIYFCEEIRRRRLSELSLTESFYQAQSLLVADSKVNDPQFLNLLAISNLMLQVIENTGKDQQLKGIEPAYHNRQHFADACLALGFFLSDSDKFSAYEQRLMLLTMLAHDYGHRGISQNLPHQSHEEETVELIRNTPLRDLPKKDFDTLCDLIIGTSPSSLTLVNSRHLQSPDNLHHFMQSLINDADIAASFIDDLTPSLTRSILIESGNLSPSGDEVLQGIKFFKENFHLTTQVARRLLL